MHEDSSRCNHLRRSCFEVAKDFWAQVAYLLRTGERQGRLGQRSTPATSGERPTPAGNTQTPGRCSLRFHVVGSSSADLSPKVTPLGNLAASARKLVYEKQGRRLTCRPYVLHVTTTQKPCKIQCICVIRFIWEVMDFPLVGSCREHVRGPVGLLFHGCTRNMDVIILASMDALDHGCTRSMKVFILASMDVFRSRVR